jgi:hypothetical protein
MVWTIWVGCLLWEAEKRIHNCFMVKDLSVGLYGIKRAIHISWYPHKTFGFAKRKRKKEIV